MSLSRNHPFDVCEKEGHPTGLEVLEDVFEVVHQLEEGSESVGEFDPGRIESAVDDKSVGQDRGPALIQADSQDVGLERGPFGTEQAQALDLGPMDLR